MPFSIKDNLNFSLGFRAASFYSKLNVGLSNDQEGFDNYLHEFLNYQNISVLPTSLLLCNTIISMSNMEQDINRIGVSLPENLLKNFDGIILQRGYSSRSEGIRDAIRNYIVSYEWMSDIQGERVGVITIVYSHAQRGLVDNLTEVQHEFGDIIKSSMHVHLDHDNCLEVVVLRGEGKDVKIAAEKMMALKGVKHVKLTTTSLGKEL